MNPEFQKRQDAVLEILSSISKMTSKPLVFIGGSAIQTAVLTNPRRLSVDLDTYYPAEIFELLSKLGPDYKIEKRPVKRGDLFSYYNIFRGNIQVKVDVARFELVQNGTHYKTTQIKVGPKTFSAFVATPDYLLASKLSALAIGSTGRSPSLPIDFVKDVFDSNCLLDEFGLPPNTLPFLHEVLATQNKIRGTSFTYERMLDDAITALLASASIEDKAATVKKADLGNFLQYVFDPSFRKQDYWEMAYRLLAVLKAIRTRPDRQVPSVLAEIEKGVSKSLDGKFIAECERQLIKKDVDRKLLQSLKIHAPKAFVYLYYYHFPVESKEATNKAD